MTTPKYDPILIEGCDTIVKLFRHRVEQLGSKIAMREKNFGHGKLGAGGKSRLATSSMTSPAGLPGDDLRGHRFRGGGGTRFEPVFEHVEAQGLEPAALLYFTDLYGSFPKEAPHYPPLWLNYADPTNHAPFGDTVHVSEN